MNEWESKRYKLGEKAKVYCDLYLENPKEFTAERVFELIFNEYENLEFYLESVGDEQPQQDETDERIKLTRTEAYAGFDEVDFKVMDQELDSLFHSDQRDDREMTTQFFLENMGKTIALEVYWDKQLVQTIRFNNKSVLKE